MTLEAFVGRSSDPVFPPQNPFIRAMKTPYHFISGRFKASAWLALRPSFRSPARFKGGTTTGDFGAWQQLKRFVAAASVVCSCLGAFGKQQPEKELFFGAMVVHRLVGSMNDTGWVLSATSSNRQTQGRTTSSWWNLVPGMPSARHKTRRLTSECTGARAARVDRLSFSWLRAPG